MKTVDFYFDLSSPYSYLAATQIGPLAARHGAAVRWKPVVLAAVFKAAGNVMPAASPPRRRTCSSTWRAGRSATASRL